MIKKINKNAVRQKRHDRLRSKISGTPERPRFNVYRSANHIYAQIIDDVNGKTLVACNTVQKDIAKAVAEMTKCDAAKYVGKVAGELALKKGITEVVFDRGGYLYTGRVQNIADGAREAGLKL